MGYRLLCGLWVWRRRTNGRRCCPPMSNPSTSSWTAWPDVSGRWDNLMAAQHLPRDLVRLSSGLYQLAQKAKKWRQHKVVFMVRHAIHQECQKCSPRGHFTWPATLTCQRLGYASVSVRQRFLLLRRFPLNFDVPIKRYEHKATAEKFFCSKSYAQPQISFSVFNPVWITSACTSQLKNNCWPAGAFIWSNLVLFGNGCDNPAIHSQTTSQAETRTTVITVACGMTNLIEDAFSPKWTTSSLPVLVRLE